MKYSNKKRDFFLNKHYKLYFLSKTYNDVLDIFLNIADEIGMPQEKAIDEACLFAQAKSHKNCLIVTIIFGSPKKANRYIQGLNKKTFNILKDHIENFLILNPIKSYSRNLENIKEIK